VSKNKNDVVFIELGGRLRELRFGHKALKSYQAISGKSLESIGDGGFKLEDIEQLIYCGLLADGHKNGDPLKLEDMEDLLDAMPLQETIDKMTEALNASFGVDPNAKRAVKK
jgi:hypothetical protein